MSEAILTQEDRERQRQKQRSQEVKDQVVRRIQELQDAGLDSLTEEDKEFLAARRPYFTSDQAEFFKSAVEEGLASMNARSGGTPIKIATSSPAASPAPAKKPK